jgi:hypothetical protein
LIPVTTFVISRDCPGGELTSGLLLRTAAPAPYKWKKWRCDTRLQKHIKAGSSRKEKRRAHLKAGMGVGTKRYENNDLRLGSKAFGSFSIATASDIEALLDFNV